jgi:hypothetical protein
MDRRTFRALVADLHFPPIEFAGRLVRGPVAWGAVLAIATPGERRQLLARLQRRLLVATVHGRRRLRAWLSESRPLPPSLRPAELRSWLRERVSFYGDTPLLDVVVAALEVAPEPVREAAIAEVAFLGVGVESRAWIISSMFVDYEDRRKSQVVVLGPTVGVRTVLHELGHAWHARQCKPGSAATPAITALAERALRLEPGCAALSALELVEERRAEACALAWLSAASGGSSRFSA